MGATSTSSSTSAYHMTVLPCVLLERQTVLEKKRPCPCYWIQKKNGHARATGWMVLERNRAVPCVAFDLPP